MDPRLIEPLKKHWGFDSLRPLQGESIAATLAGRDSLTVLPTGGGKSLCYQLPPLVLERPTLVISPLIALMNDQVASLRVAGIPAAAVHSQMSPEDRAQARELAASGRLRVLLTSPERLLSPGFLDFVARLRPGAIAIDEAHCISHWGHDFRPEYRQLATLRTHPALAALGAPLGAYTATATPRVQQDIVDQLGLRDPAVLVGRFDRPNLTYRIQPRGMVLKQVMAAIQRHRRPVARGVHATIIYCLTRKETSALASDLCAKGFSAAAYHAGMNADERRRVADDFRRERLDIVVATVAFGMGIDRPDVRLILHAGLPESIESYQQQTGRAGRDGLPAECLLLYSSADVARWTRLINSPPAEGEPAPPEVIESRMQHLAEVRSLAGGARCRHRALSEHFGQAYQPADPDRGCAGCDVCLRELSELPESQTVARKVLSCVARITQRGPAMGAGHVADVLMGRRIATVTQRGHDQLSTFGLLPEFERERVIGFIDQLVDEGCLVRAPGQYPTITLGHAAADVLRDERVVRLVEAVLPEDERITDRREGLTTAESEVFEALRLWRRQTAETRGVPPFVIFADTVLEELARCRPASPETLINIRGVGTRKAEAFGAGVLAVIAEVAARLSLPLDAAPGSRPRSLKPPPAAGLSSGAEAAAEHFRRGAPVLDVAEAMGRKPSTVSGYLTEWIQSERPESVAPWVAPALYERIDTAARELKTDRLGPIKQHLEADGSGEVPFDQIRIVMTHRRVATQRA